MPSSREGSFSDELLKCFEKSYRAAKRARIEAGLDFAIHAGLEHGRYVPRGRKAGGRENRQPVQVHYDGYYSTMVLT
jgi:hypothetical protein